MKLFLAVLLVGVLGCVAQQYPVKFFKGGPREDCDTVCHNKGGSCDEDLAGLDIEKQMMRVHKCPEVYDSFKLQFEPIWDWRDSCIGISLQRSRCHARSDNPDDRRFCKCVMDGGEAADKEL